MNITHTRLLLLLPVLFLLSGCYIPYAYLTKIEIMSNGRYSLKFQGRVVSASFLRKIGEEELKAGDEDYDLEKVAHGNELKRQGFMSPQYVYPASYETSFEAKGNLFKERTVTFPSRTGPALIIKLLKDNKVVIESSRMNPEYANKLEASGIPFVGSIAIWTDTVVQKHNAHHFVPGTPANAYAWEMNSLSDKPIQLIGVLGSK